MIDKFDDFMKRNSPSPEGALKQLDLPSRKKWMSGIVVSGALMASLVVTMMNRTNNFENFDEGLDISLEDEFPAEYQDVENFLEEI